MSGHGKVRTSPAYQTMLVVLLGVNMGVVFLDRAAFGLLAPMIQPEFDLSNTQIGVINGALAATWAISSFGLARLADLSGSSKRLLVAATVTFSLASISSGLAVGFLTLVAARALMGVAEGGLPPVSMNIVNTEVPPERRGLAIGMMSTIGLNAIPMLGPLVIVGIGTLYGWREAFWIAGIPGIVMAGLIWFLIREPTERTSRADKQKLNGPEGGILSLLRIRNIPFTMVLATLNMTLTVGTLGFLPLYLVNVLGMTNALMGVVITTVLLSQLCYGFIGPMLSDRVGRKPTMIASCALSATGFLILINSGGALALVFTGAMLGGAYMGGGILVMAVIPGESAPPHLKATAMGLNSAVGELLGAGAMPVLIGILSDQIGLGILPWILAGAALLSSTVALNLRETAPNLLARRAAALTG
jgi:ACS family hexuronate transporter-like MFS transporter